MQQIESKTSLEEKRQEHMYVCMYVCTHTVYVYWMLGVGDCKVLNPGQEILREALLVKSPVIRLLSALSFSIKVWRSGIDAVTIKYQQLFLFCSDTPSISTLSIFQHHSSRNYSVITSGRSGCGCCYTGSSNPVCQLQ